MHRDRAHTIVALLAIVALVVGCGSAAPSPLPDGPSSTPLTAMPPASPAAARPSPSVVIATPTTEPPTPVPTPTPTTAPPPPDPLAGKTAKGSVVVTVSDNLVVRSEPRVSADSTMYKPWLPLGTELTVFGGPEVGSGYTWYQVAPVSFEGLGGPGYGWVAAAGKDGEPWIAIASAAKEPPGVTLVQSEVARATANPKDAKSAAASVNAFGLDLLRAMLADPALDLADKNAVFSPTSIALALAMARAGAKGETASQMDAVLHTTGWDALGPGLNALDQALASRDGPWQWGNRSGQLALSIPNTAFGQQGWKIEQPYLERIAATFGSGLRLLDYKADPEAARVAINAWVRDQTKKRIPDLIPKVTPPLIDKLTRLVLVNAIYLKATWENEFAKSETKPARFTRLDGSRVAVPTMNAEFQGDTPYATGRGWRATELRYRGPDGAPLAMTLVLPDDLAAFEKSLSPSILTRITGSIAKQRELLAAAVNCEDEPTHKAYALSLFMPRFGVETHASLEALLEALGMPLAFTGGADFSGIHVPESDEEILQISDVIHQANIDVDEEGTVAAAATAVIMGGTTGGCYPVIGKTITLRLDHPFLFFVRDLETGAVLFMGRVVDPSVGR